MSSIKSELKRIEKGGKFRLKLISDAELQCTMVSVGEDYVVVKSLEYETIYRVPFTAIAWWIRSD